VRGEDTQVKHFRAVVASIMAAALVPAAAVAAADQSEDEAAGRAFNIMGPSSCARWPKTGAISSAGKAVPLNWALGYLSGSAVGGRLALLDLIEPDEVATWLDAYCADNPDASLPNAVRALGLELEARLPPLAPPPPPTFVERPPAKAKPAPKAAAKAAPRRQSRPAAAP